MSSASSSSSYFNTSTIVAIVSTSALVYTQWSSLPAWMKLGFGSSSSKHGNDEKSRNEDSLEKDANDHLATPSAVLSKLQEMMTLVAKVSDDVSPTKAGVRGGSSDDNSNNSVSQVQMVAALYSLVHLNSELYAKDPDYRDKLYEDDREHDDAELDELKELSEYLEYAHWAYEACDSVISANCRKTGLDLMKFDPATEPGRVGHFIALDHDKKLAIIGLKGTSTVSDVLTDLIAIPKEHVGCYFDDKTFAAPSANASEAEKAAATMRCHEGIFTAAQWMADTLQAMIENLLVPLKYKLVICGHSLGAGTACLLGLELRSRIPAFRKNYTDLRVLAFATPPVVSFRASKACAPFVTSVVNNCDVIPRSSVSNLVVMNKLLLKVCEKLQAKGLALDSWTSLRKYYDEHSKIDDDLLLTEDELENFFNETHAAPEKEDNALFVPGRLVVMWDKGENDDGAIGSIVTDGGMKMLRQIELSLTLITDHFVKEYRCNLHKRIEELENSI